MSTNMSFQPCMAHIPYTPWLQVQQGRAPRCMSCCSPRRTASQPFLRSPRRPLSGPGPPAWDPHRQKEREVSTQGRNKLKTDVSVFNLLLPTTSYQQLSHREGRRSELPSGRRELYRCCSPAFCWGRNKNTTLLKTTHRPGKLHPTDESGAFTCELRADGSRSCCPASVPPILQAP